MNWLTSRVSKKEGKFDLEENGHLTIFYQMPFLTPKTSGYIERFDQGNRLIEVPVKHPWYSVHRHKNTKLFEENIYVRK